MAPDLFANVDRACEAIGRDPAEIIKSIALFCSAIVSASALWLAWTWSSLFCVVSSFSCGVAAEERESSPIASAQIAASSSAANSVRRRLVAPG